MRDVCEITGLSRRTLQGYNEQGILEPSSKTEAGYWLYSEEDIIWLMRIKIMQEIGLSRKQIKEVKEDPDKKMDQVLLAAKEKLLEKRQTINAMIHWIEMTEALNSMPESAITSLAEISTDTDDTEEKNFTDIWNDNLNRFTKINTFDDITLDAGFCMTIIAVAGMKELHVLDPVVQESVRSLYEQFIKIDNRDNPENKKKPERERVWKFNKEIWEISKDENIVNALQGKVDHEGLEFVSLSVCIFTAKML